MKNIKIKISVFNRYLILLIAILFSYLFYLSIPVIYNYDKLQKELTKKLINEFNLNASLSNNIVYNILPSPNFEISDVILSTDSDEKFNDFAHIKKLKIFISISKIYSQKKIQINKIVLFNSNINIDSKSLNYINNFLNKKSFSKDIQIKKSKVFFIDNNNTEDAIALSNIVNAEISHVEKNNNNKVIINGSIFNAKYNFKLLRQIGNSRFTKSSINFNSINTKIINEIFQAEDDHKNSNGKIQIKSLGVETKINYNIKNKLITFFPEKKSKSINNVNFNGDINISPFYYNINMNVEEVNVIKFVKNLFKLNLFLDKKYLLNKNFNGLFKINLNQLKNNKFFDSAKIKFKFFNEKLILDQTIISSNKIGSLTLIDSFIFNEDDKLFFKSKFLFNIKDQNKFYKTLQIPKKNRIKLKNIYFEVNINSIDNDLNFSKVIINTNINNLSEGKPIDLSEIEDINKIKDLKNWIEVKKISNKLFQQINLE